MGADAVAVVQESYDGKSWDTVGFIQLERDYEFFGAVAGIRRGPALKEEWPRGLPEGFELEESNMHPDFLEWFGHSPGLATWLTPDELDWVVSILKRDNEEWYPSNALNVIMHWVFPQNTRIKWKYRVVILWDQG